MVFHLSLHVKINNSILNPFNFRGCSRSYLIVSVSNKVLLVILKLNSPIFINFMGFYLKSLYMVSLLVDISIGVSLFILLHTVCIGFTIITAVLKVSIIVGIIDIFM